MGRALSARVAVGLAGCLVVLGCDPGGGSPPKSSPSAAPNAAASGAPAPPGTETTGVYDYSAVVSLDDPDGPARVLTFAVTTARKLKGFTASTITKDSSPFQDLGLDFATQSLVIVVRPGSGPPPVIVSVERSEKGALVRYTIPPLASDPGQKGQGRFTARVVSPQLAGSTKFEEVAPPK